MVGHSTDPNCYTLPTRLPQKWSELHPPTLALFEHTAWPSPPSSSLRVGNRFYNFDGRHGLGGDVLLYDAGRSVAKFHD